MYLLPLLKNIRMYKNRLEYILVTEDFEYTNINSMQFLFHKFTHKKFRKQSPKTILHLVHETSMHQHYLRSIPSPNQVSNNSIWLISLSPYCNVIIYFDELIIVKNFIIYTYLTNMSAISHFPNFYEQFNVYAKHAVH